MTSEEQVITLNEAARSSHRELGSTSEIDFSSNDYLGLRSDRRVRAAAIRGIEEFGVGSGGVREVAAWMSVVRELELRLARFKGVPAVRMVQSGYFANLGIVPLLVGHGDFVVLDRQNHQSSKAAPSFRAHPLWPIRTRIFQRSRTR